MTQTTIGSALDHKKEIKITLDKEYTLNPLTVAEIYPVLEEKIKSKAIKDGLMVANSLPKEEKLNFITTVWKSLPKGAELEQLVSEFLQSIDGIQTIFEVALKKIGVSLDIAKYINVDNFIDFMLQFYDLMGIEYSEEVDEKKAQ